MSLFRFSLLFLLLGCSQNIKLNAPTDEQSSSSVKITILSQSSAIADGFTDLTVTILIKDLLDNVVANYMAPVKIRQGNGVNYFACSASDALGQSQCIFRATIGGTKEVQIANTDLQISFIDSTMNRGTMFSVVSSAQNNVSAGTDTVNATVGPVHDNPRQQIGTGTIYTDISIQQ